MNVIGTQLRDLINSGPTRWRMAVLNTKMDAAAELGRNPVSKHQIQPEYGTEQADAGRDCRTHLARSNSQARTNVDRPIVMGKRHTEIYSTEIKVFIYYYVLEKTQRKFCVHVF